MVGNLNHHDDCNPKWKQSRVESKVPWYEICDDLPQTTTEESQF